jgi:exosortase D (VPLPA-CTERM-specific)
MLRKLLGENPLACHLTPKERTESSRRLSRFTANQSVLMSAQSIELPKIGTIRPWVFGLIALLLGFFGFSGALFELIRRWSTQEEYSHGFLIPLVAAWLLWTRRGALIASIGRPAWTGPVLILLAMAMHVMGELSAIFILSQLAYVVTLLGIVLAIGGFSLLRVAFVPIIFLLFSIPLPYFIDAHLSLQLQLISSQLGVSFIRLFQIPVYLDGNIIDLGTYKLQVVDACSGLRYLFPLLSLGFLAAYLFHAPIWQRATVLLSCIPITIAMNGFRIGIVGVTVDHWGPKMADGVLHFFEGWIIFVACAFLLTAEIYLLARLSHRRFFEAFYAPMTAGSSTELEPGTTGRMPITVCLLLMSTTVLMGTLISNRSEIIPERDHFTTFPTILGEWHGRVALLDPQVEHGLALDDYILSDYSKPDGKAVNLYVAYYASQRKGESPHSPLVCIPGDGWSITRFERTNYDLGTEHPLNRAIIERNGSKQIVYYWYDERGRKIASEYWSKWYLLADAITKNRSDGALVRIITPVFPGEVERDADSRLQLFMKTLLPNLVGYLPSDAAPKISAVHYSPQGSEP